MNSPVHNPLTQSILKTIAYFDIFDYPLTLVELRKWLYQPDTVYSLSDIQGALSGLRQIEHHFGFYFVAGRAEIVELRRQRYNLAEVKFRRARLASAWLARLGLVKMIAVCNNVGYNNGSATSDIDFFIIAPAGRLWLTRLTAIIVTSVLGIRRKGDKEANRICLSFYLSQARPDLANVRLAEGDPYLAYWLATLAPIYGQRVYEDFLKSNAWLKTYLPNFYPTALINRRQVFTKPWLVATFWKTATRLGGEQLAKQLQWGRLQRYFGGDLESATTNVMVSDDILKLHKTDRRAWYYQTWRKKVSQLDIV